MPVEQIRAQTARTFHRLVVAPLVYARLMTRQQYVGHTPAIVVGRTGIDGRSKQIVLKRVGQGALFVADRSRNEPYYGVGDHHRRKLASGEHIVAY